jgi:hypothetical protein
MKKAILCTMLIVSAFACKKLDDVKSPEFNVTTEKTTYKVNEQVDFNFTGDVDIISIFSGTIGNDYDHTDGRIMTSKFLINFETHTLDGTQTNQIAILMSKDFNKDYSINGVNQANWIDVSSKFRLATPADNRAWVNSGFGDISEYLDLQNPETIYLAVKHTVRNQNLYGTGNLNRVRNFKLLASNDLGETSVFTHTIANWNLFSTPNKMPNRASLEASQMTLRQSTGTAYAAENTEDWVVSVPINITPSIDMGPDLAIGIKNLAEKMPKSYAKTFTKAGTYNVVFKAINQNIEGRKEIIKQIKIIIED